MHTPSQGSTDVQLRRACADLEQRLRGGEVCSAEELLAAHPDLAAHADSALELIYTEFVVREQLGQQPSPAEWYARFPPWRDDLEQIFQVHKAMGDTGGGGSTGDYAIPAVGEARPPLSPGGEGAADHPRRVGPYELLGEIGRGGMGVVYKARSVALKRVVALKMILGGEDAGPEERGRFRTEAKAVADLQHPNIVQIFEVGEWRTGDGRGPSPCLALEYVEGGSLQQKLAESLPTPREAARLVELLARAVHYAHEHGVLHRDLKPGNVLLTADGTPKITDFGLAKRLGLGDAGGDQTRTGALLGTPTYMAPEQAGGDGRQVGRAADVHALGATLYEMLAGRPPFRGTSPLDILEQVRTWEPAPPSRLQPKIPRDLETICLKCLRKEPQQRYASALELADDLRRFLVGEPIRARPTPAWERAAKWARRRPAVAALLAAVVAVAALGAGAFAWSWRQTVDALGQAERGRDHEHELKEQAEAALAEKTVALARNAWLADDQDQARRLLDECPSSHRDRDWRYLDRVCHACLMSLPQGDRPADIGVWPSIVAWSPDGGCLASSGWNDGCAIRVWDPWNGREGSTLRGHVHPVQLMGFASDGQLVTVGVQETLLGMLTRQKVTPNEVKVWDVAGGREVQGYVTSQSVIGLNGRYFTSFVSQVGRIPGLKFATIPPTDVVPPMLTLWAAATGQKALTLPPDPSCIWNSIVSDDGRLLAVNTTDAVHFWDVASVKEVGSWGPPFSVGPLVFSPDDRLLAGIAKDGLFRNVSIRDVATGAEVSSVGHPDRISAMAFSPDGRRLATAVDRTVILWDVTTGRELLTFRGHTDIVRSVAFSPDGRRLASASLGTVKIWDVRPLEAP